MNPTELHQRLRQHALGLPMDFPPIDLKAFADFVAQNLPGEIAFAEKLFALAASRDVTGFFALMATAGPEQWAVFQKFLQLFQQAQTPPAA